LRIRWPTYHRTLRCPVQPTLPERCAALPVQQPLRRASVKGRRRVQHAVASAVPVVEMPVETLVETVMGIEAEEAVALRRLLRPAQLAPGPRPLRPLLKAARVEAAVCGAAQQCRACRSSSRLMTA